MGQHEVRHVIGGEGAFEPVRRQLSAGKHIAGVVDEYIDARLGGGDLLADPLHFRDNRQVGKMRPVGKAGASLTQLREGGLCPLRVPRHQNDSRPKCSKPRGGDLPDAGGGAGDDNDLAVNGGLLGSKFPFECGDLLHQ